MVWEQRYAVGHRRQIIIIWLALNWLSMKYFAMLRGSDCFTQWKIQCLNCASVLGNKNVMTYKYQRPLLKRTIVVGEILIPMSLQDFCFPLKINIGTCVKQTFWRYCMFKERVSKWLVMSVSVFYSTVIPFPWFLSQLLSILNFGPSQRGVLKH